MTRLLACVSAAIVLGALSESACAQKPAPGLLKVKVLNGNRVYHPRGLKSNRTYLRKNPALIDSRTVFDATPEYRKIVRDRVDPDSAEYGLLKRQASDRFKTALRKTMSLGGYDLIAEKGAIIVAGHQLPDITRALVQNL